MRSVSISVTEASRNFADCINRSRYQGTTFILHKNGVAVARLIPEQKAMKEEELSEKPKKPGAPAEKPEAPEPARNSSAIQKAREIW